MAGSHAAKKQNKSAKGNRVASSAGSSKLRGNAQMQTEDQFADLEPLIEPSANRDIAGVVVAVIAVASFIAVVSPSSAPVTLAISRFYHLGFGLGAYVLPLVLLLFAATLFLRDRSPLNMRSVLGGALVFIGIISALSLMVPGTDISTDGMFEATALVTSGGYVGSFIASLIQSAFGKTIAMVILVGLIVVGFVVIGFSISEFVRGAAEKAQTFVDRHHVDVNAAPWGDDEAYATPAAPASMATRVISPLARQQARGARFESSYNDSDRAFEAAETRLLADDESEDSDPFVDVSEMLEAERAQTTLLPFGALKRKKGKGNAVDKQPDDSAVENTSSASPGSPMASSSTADSAKTTLLSTKSVKEPVEDTVKPKTIKPIEDAVAIPDFLLNPKVSASGDAGEQVPETSVSLDRNPDAPDTSAPKTTTATEASQAIDDSEELTLPPISMLRHNPKSSASSSSEKELEQTAEALQGTLEEFGRTSRVVGWISGPTVTTFKLQPGEGERVSKITALEDDIALSLAAQSVRIFAPIPGTSLVGIEIPNRTRQNVFLGDVLPYVKGGPLELAIGRDAEGTPIVADLAKMPHLLIAGTTGSGKSVMINSIITTLLMRARPEDVRLIMVDPKRVELAGYNDLPHLYVPVVTEPKQAASALQWAVSEMERRLKVFERLNVRKISTFNEKQAAGEFEHYDNPPKKMPYLVIIIDELSDLMMVAGKDVEASIVRIAQLGRAAGIHLIVATQRPSSNVVTGLIKANITNRIAFNVATGIDSRVIIDQMGAEKLTGLGDMLFSKVDWGKPRRIQGCFVSDEEINEIVEFVKSQSEPDYHEEILSAVSPAMVASTGAGPVRTSNAEPENDDPLVWEAAKIVVETQLGSTSGLQRRLKVGYARAGRIMDMLEEKGIVGPPDGSKPREVLLDEEGLEALKDIEAQMQEEDSGFGEFGGF